MGISSEKIVFTLTHNLMFLFSLLFLVKCYFDKRQLKAKVLFNKTEARKSYDMLIERRFVENQMNISYYY